MNCVPNSLILPSEWDDAIERVTKAQLHLAFREVFLIEMVMSHRQLFTGTENVSAAFKGKVYTMAEDHGLPVTSLRGCPVPTIWRAFSSY